MRQPYVSPAVIEYGSIADCTFVTPAVNKKNPLLDVRTFPADPIDGDYQCDTDPNRVHTAANFGEGGKNYIAMQCDKFGEYSHGDGAGS